MIQRMSKWRRAVRELEEKLGRCPSHAELARTMKVPTSKLDLIQRTMAGIERSVTTSGSEDQGRSHPLDSFPAPTSSYESSQEELRDDIMKVRSLLKHFDPVTSDILRMRFGLDGSSPLTLKEIGKHLGLTRERVRQIEHQAIGRLKRGFKIIDTSVMAQHIPKQAS
jgi:RNA polymerase primary sigma factor